MDDPSQPNENANQGPESPAASDCADGAANGEGPGVVEQPVTHQEAAALFASERPHLQIFLANIETAIAETAPPEFKKAVYTIRARLKDPQSLAGKLRRRAQDGIVVTRSNFFDHIEDLAGLRIVTLYRWGFEPVHDFIATAGRRWWRVLREPEAYAVNPEDIQRFKSIGLNPRPPKPNRDPRTPYTPYTSIHYTLTPVGQDYPRCEVQVRGLHLEGWGEVDHELRYPDKNPGPLACDLLVLLHQAAAVTDWLAHLAGRAAEAEQKSFEEKDERDRTLNRLAAQLDAATKDNALLQQAKASLNETIASLRNQLDRVAQFPSVGVTGGAQGPMALMFGSCGICGRISTENRICSRCQRPFCDSCGSEPRILSIYAAGVASMLPGYRLPDRPELCKVCAAAPR